MVGSAWAAKAEQPEAPAAPGQSPVVDERKGTQGLDVVCLQDEAHVGFMSMVESIMRQAENRTCSA